MRFQRPYSRSVRAADKPHRFARLPGAIDVDPLLDEVDAASLPWLGSQWKWHLQTRFAILRGGPPTGWPGGEMTSGAGVDTPLLARLPRLRAALDGAFPAPAALAWLGLSPPGARIFLHVDNTPHWDEHHRVHLPLRTTPQARLCVRGRFQHFPAGSIWTIDNSSPHGALNEGPDRLHLLVDLPDTEPVRAWLARGDGVDGDVDDDALAQISGDPFAALSDAQRADADLMRRLRLQ